MSESIPPLRISNIDGTFNQIPVFEMQLSGGVLTKLSPTKVRLAISGAMGPSGPAGASLSDLPYVTFVANDTLSAEKVLTAGSSISIRTDTNAIYIDALTNAGAGIVYAPTGGEYVTFVANGTLTAEKVLTAGSSITIRTDASAIYINAVTNAAGGVVYAATGAYYIMSQTNDSNMTVAKLLKAGSSTALRTDGGAVYIDALTNAAGGTVYAPTGGNYIAFKADSDLSNEKVLTAGSSVLITTDANAVYISALTNAAGGVIYAPTGGKYISYGADADLSSELILKAGSSVTLTSDATSVYVNATTNTGVAGAVYAATGAYYIMAQTNDANMTNAKLLKSGSNTVIRTDNGATYIDVSTSNILAFVTTDRTLTAVYPLTGGGNLSANRSFSIDTAFLINTGRTISAGSGLTGGGDLSADRTLSVNTNVRDKTMVAFLKGVIATSTTMEFMRAYIPFNMTPYRMQMVLNTTADETTAVNLYQYPNPIATGTAMLASAASIPAATYAGSATTFDYPTLYAGSYLGFVIVRASTGATVGSNMTITLISRTS